MEKNKEFKDCVSQSSKHIKYKSCTMNYERNVNYYVEKWFSSYEKLCPRFPLPKNHKTFFCKYKLTNKLYTIAT